MNKRKYVVINKDELSDLYFIEKKSTRNLAAHYKCSQRTICRKLKEFNIPVRTYKENPMPVKKGSKRSWSVVSDESNKKRSIALKGTFHPRRTIDYRPSIAVNCHICGLLLKKQYSQWKKSGSKHFYCSKHNGYYNRGRTPPNKKDKITLKCDNCGTYIARIPSQAIAYKKHFCSPKCNGEWKAKNINGDKVYNWKGGYQDYYGPNWNFQRKKCIERDSNTCNICCKVANGRNMDVDHKTPFEAFKGDYKKANDLLNLWCLCPSCHTRKTNWQVKFGLISIDEWTRLFKSWCKTLILK